MPKCFINRKTLKPYYQIMADLPKLGDNSRYILYQNSKGDLYAREQEEFYHKFDRIESDAVVQCNPWAIRRLEGFIASIEKRWGHYCAFKLGGQYYQPFLSILDVMVVIMEDATIVDATNKNDGDHLALFYDVYTSSFWLAKTMCQLPKSSYPLVDKRVLLKSICCEDSTAMPVFLQRSDCEHEYGTRISSKGDTTTLNKTKPGIYYCSQGDTLQFVSVCKKCGQGLNLYYYREHGAKRVYIWDKNEHIIKNTDMVAKNPTEVTALNGFWD